ncbi:MAG: hypothetical protein WCK02_17800 [Bacteroidota bacterium]
MDSKTTQDLSNIFLFNSGYGAAVGSSGTIVTFYNDGLPIQLVDFSAKFIDEKVLLYWQTASEIENDYFSIEKSADAKNFELVKNITGAGYSNSIITYNEIDDNPYRGVSYYRLKQTDYNGESTFSNIIAVYNSKNSSLDVKIITYNDNNFLIEASNFEGEYICFEIFNISGEQLYSKFFYVNKNCCLIKINCVEFIKGSIYIARVFDNNEEIVEKIIY